jgi:hypothetical protein
MYRTVTAHAEESCRDLNSQGDVELERRRTNQWSGLQHSLAIKEIYHGQIVYGVCVHACPFGRVVAFDMHTLTQYLDTLR